MGFYLELIDLPYKQTKEESDRRICLKVVQYASIIEPMETGFERAHQGLRPA